MELPHDERGNVVIAGRTVEATQADCDRVAAIIADVYHRAGPSHLSDVRGAFDGRPNGVPARMPVGFGQFEGLPEIFS